MRKKGKQGHRDIALFFAHNALSGWRDSMFSPGKDGSHLDSVRLATILIV